MASVSLRILSPVLFTTAIFTACSGGSGDPEGSEGAGSSGGHEFAVDGGPVGEGGANTSSSGASSGSGTGSGSGSSGSGSGSSSGGGGECGSCTTDADCQSSCPPVQGPGANCCDTGSGVCYSTAQTSCPDTTKDAGPG